MLEGGYDIFPMFTLSGDSPTTKTLNSTSISGCPLVNHIDNPADYTQCCTRADGDCVAPFTGDISSFQNCNGKRSCTDITVVRGYTNSTCFFQGGYNQNSNYMIFEYECVPGKNITQN